MANHRDTHPDFVDGCYGCKLLQINIGGFPTGPTVTERRWDRDMRSYKNLRKDGLQPPSIDGAAQLENATDQFEIDAGQLLPKKEDRDKAREGIELAKEMQGA